MKRFILIITATVFAALSLNAQVVSGNSSNVQYLKGNLYQNGIKLTSEQALQVLGQDVYDSAYKPAKGLRTAGIVMVSAGGASTLAGAGFFIAAVTSKSAADALLVLPGTYLAVGGAAVTIVGGILWGSGNKKMKRIAAASSGVGLALVF